MNEQILAQLAALHIQITEKKEELAQAIQANPADDFIKEFINEEINDLLNQASVLIQKLES